MQPVDNSRLLRRSETDFTDLLVCFPHAGAGISVFRNWPARFRNHLGIAMVQLPGREDRIHEAFTSTLADLAKTISDALARSGATKLFLFGHSMGASIAWAVAEQLWFTHRCRPILIVSAQSPTPVVHEKLNDLPGWFERMGEKFPAALKHPELRAMFDQTWASDVAWMNRELPQFKPCMLPVDLHALYGLQDGLIGRTDAAKWRSCTSRYFGITGMQGGHLYWLSQPEQLYQAVEQLIHRYAHATS